MLPIGRFAKLANVSPRTLRFYESIGLIESGQRGDNNYRLYDSHCLAQVTRIRELQELGFTLEEIKDILKVSENEFVQDLIRKLHEVENDLLLLGERKAKIINLLSVSKKIQMGQALNDIERRGYMDAIQTEIIEGLKARSIPLTPVNLQYLRRDLDFHSPEKAAYLDAVKKCLRFAQERNLKLGRVRGGLAASLVLHALGLNPYRPQTESFFPERFSGDNIPDIHIDVEFERGQEFVDFCAAVSQNLPFGKINAFKMPLIDIIERTQENLSQRINFDEISNDSDIVLSPIRRAALEKIFIFDISPDALILKYENRMDGYENIDKVKEYVASQKIHSFRDVQNILSLYLPSSNARLEKLERYRQAKITEFKYSELDPSLQETLRPNYGLLIYHEDMIRIVSHYTGWSHAKANDFRKNHRSFLREGDLHSPDFQEFRKLVPTKIVDLYLRENPLTFCQPHIMSFSYFTKATAVLKHLHESVYLRQIDSWEQKNGFRWDDIGIKIKGVSILQS